VNWNSGLLADCPPSFPSSYEHTQQWRLRPRSWSPLLLQARFSWNLYPCGTLSPLFVPPSVRPFLAYVRSPIHSPLTPSSPPPSLPPSLSFSLTAHGQGKAARSHMV